MAHDSGSSSASEQKIDEVMKKIETLMSQTDEITKHKLTSEFLEPTHDEARAQRTAIRRRFDAFVVTLETTLKDSLLAADDTLTEDAAKIMAQESAQQVTELLKSCKLLTNAADPDEFFDLSAAKKRLMKYKEDPVDIHQEKEKRDKAKKETEAALFVLFNFIQIQKERDDSGEKMPTMSEVEGRLNFIASDDKVSAAPKVTKVLEDYIQTIHEYIQNGGEANGAGFFQLKPTSDALAAIKDKNLQILAQVEKTIISADKANAKMAAITSTLPYLEPSPEEVAQYLSNSKDRFNTLLKTNDQKAMGILNLITDVGKLSRLKLMSGSATPAEIDAAIKAISDHQKELSIAKEKTKVSMRDDLAELVEFKNNNDTEPFIIPESFKTWIRRPIDYLLNEGDLNVAAELADLLEPTSNVLDSFKPKIAEIAKANAANGRCMTEVIKTLLSFRFTSDDIIRLLQADVILKTLDGVTLDGLSGDSDIFNAFKLSDEGVVDHFGLNARVDYLKAQIKWNIFGNAEQVIYALEQVDALCNAGSNAKAAELLATLKEANEHVRRTFQLKNDADLLLSDVALFESHLIRHKFDDSRQLWDTLCRVENADWNADDNAVNALSDLKQLAETGGIFFVSERELDALKPEIRPFIDNMHSSRGERVGNLIRESQALGLTFTKEEIALLKPDVIVELTTCSTKAVDSNKLLEEAKKEQKKKKEEHREVSAEDKNIANDYARDRAESLAKVEGLVFAFGIGKEDVMKEAARLQNGGNAPAATKLLSAFGIDALELDTAISMDKLIASLYTADVSLMLQEKGGELLSYCMEHPDKLNTVVSDRGYTLADMLAWYAPSDVVKQLLSAATSDARIWQTIAETHRLEGGYASRTLSVLKTRNSDFVPNSDLIEYLLDDGETDIALKLTSIALKPADKDGKSFKKDVMDVATALANREKEMAASRVVFALIKPTVKDVLSFSPEFVSKEVACARVLLNNGSYKSAAGIISAFHLADDKVKSKFEIRSDVVLIKSAVKDVLLTEPKRAEFEARSTKLHKAKTLLDQNSDDPSEVIALLNELVQTDKIAGSFFFIKKVERFKAKLKPPEQASAEQRDTYADVVAHLDAIKVFLDEGFRDDAVEALSDLKESSEIVANLLSEETIDCIKSDVEKYIPESEPSAVVDAAVAIKLTLTDEEAGPLGPQFKQDKRLFVGNNANEHSAEAAAQNEQQRDGVASVLSKLLRKQDNASSTKKVN